MQSFTVRSEGARVVLIINGQGNVLPWEAADELAKALTAKARQSEEIAKHDLITKDGAILLRLGVPIGFSNHPAIRADIEHTAQYDSNLRRYLPGGIKSREHFGTPSIIRHAPPGGTHG